MGKAKAKKRLQPKLEPDDRAEAKSKVGQRAREEDMRSAVEPGSREEDTIPVRCRDTGSEGGGYGARLSDNGNMNSIGSVDNTMTNMSAMQFRVGWIKMWPRSRGERSHISCRNEFPQGGNAAGRKGGGEAPAVLGGI